jgi:hypothetical protein
VFSGALARAAPPPYQPIGAYSIPSPIFDAAPDGRIYSIVGNAVMRQNSLNGSTFSQVASLPAGSISPFGASFLRFSPDGRRLAIGDGNFNAAASVYIIDADPLDTPIASSTPAVITNTAPTPNFDASWDSTSRLFITGSRASDFVPIVNRLDLPSSAITTVITNIGGASGGITLHNNRLFTGSGFMPTGEIRSFDLASLSGAPAAPFSSGALFGSVLSASPLGFDESGDLLVGGGDAFSGTSDFGYAAIIDPLDPTHPLHLSPAGSQTLYSINFNHATHELLVFDSATNTIHRYAIPAPPAAAVLALSTILATRRRRP